MPRPARLVVLPIGRVHPTIPPAVSAAVTRVYGMPTSGGPVLDRPQYAFNKDRGQYHATAVLRRLASLAPARDAGVLGVADVDLFVPDADWVLGDADRQARAAVVSLSRLADPDRARLRRRAEVEGVHEAGHLLGLSHCPDWHCVMFLSRDPADTDRKGPGLCVNCRTALGLG